MPQRKVNAYQLQIDNDITLTLVGELRDDNHELGPGGTFQVITPIMHKLGLVVAIPGSTVRLIALPDAPRMSKTNRARKKVEDER